MPQLETRHLCRYRAALASPQQDIGVGHFGRRMIAQVTGGEFEGERLRGQVLPGGGDWATIDAGGTLRLDARVALETHDGARIYISYHGVLRPYAVARAHGAKGGPADEAEASQLYFRTAPVFETGDARYAWLNDIVAVATGKALGHSVEYEVFEVL
ncbi:DUF3237 domain-containing protein [Phenylobacterium sp.]|uniref:DUF3237 domain-containing protein n=1 Tax=Phenylobacterium sp. TaxID=1871053 RepID=UPI0025DEA809|nr:DUF3237 domain-containing protein [Phenylobacterium sp.]